MRQATPAALWTALVGLVLSLGGCGKVADADVNSDEDDGPNPPAVSVEQGIAAIDLRQFPVMDGATRIDKSASHAGFSVPNGNIHDAVEFARAKLGALGWKPVADPKLTQIVGEGAMLFFGKDGQRLFAAIGVSPADKNLNFGLFHLGNIDARKLPKFPGISFVDSNPSRTAATTDAKPEDVQKALRKPFTDLGWREYSDPPIKGLPRFAREDRSLKFLQNGVRVEVTITPFQGKTRVDTDVRLRDVQWPIEPSATHVNYQPDPLFLFYPTRLGLKEAVEFNTRELTALGWKATSGRQSPDQEVVRFESVDQEPLRLEVGRDRDLTFVMLRRWSKDDDK